MNGGTPDTPVVLTADNVMQFLLDMSAVLAEQHPLQRDEWVTVPTEWYENYMQWKRQQHINCLIRRNRQYRRPR